MKKILLGLLLAIGVGALTTTTAFSQSSFSYQAVIRNADGKMLSGDTVAMKFKLMDSKGVSYYEEVQDAAVDAFGNVSVLVGEGEATSGSFADVQWSSLNVMMKVMLDVKRNGTFIDFAEMQIQPVPYAMYAASTKPTTEIVAKSGSNPDEPLFSVKDNNGNLVFAVYRDSVKVIVDDSVSTGKAVKSGFVVSNRRATKDDATSELFVIDANGTQIYVDSDSSKAVKSGFVVSNRRATKDGDAEELLVVSDGTTQVFIDDADAGKAVKSGFVVSNRRATKDGDASDLITVNSEGVQVFIDDDESKAVKSGFVVSNRRATKDGETDNLFAVEGDLTHVYVDSDSSKAVKSGFVVSNRRATKDAVGNEYLAVNAEGTHVFVDDTESKAVKSGFVVSNRRATKDGEADNLFVVEGSNTHVYIDQEVDSKAVKSGFAVSGRKATKGNSDYLTITDKQTKFGVNDTVGAGFAILNIANGDTVLAVNPNNVDFGAILKVTGDIEHSYVYKTLPDTLWVYMNQNHGKPCVLNTNAMSYCFKDALFNMTDKQLGKSEIYFVDKSGNKIDKFEAVGTDVKLDFSKFSLNNPSVVYTGDANCEIDSLLLCLEAPGYYELNYLPVKFFVNEDPNQTSQSDKPQSGIMEYVLNCNNPNAPSTINIKRYFKTVSEDEYFEIFDYSYYGYRVLSFHLSGWSPAFYSVSDGSCYSFGSYAEYAYLFIGDLTKDCTYLTQAGVGKTELGEKTLYPAYIGVDNDYDYVYKTFNGIVTEYLDFNYRLVIDCVSADFDCEMPFDYPDEWDSHDGYVKFVESFSKYIGVTYVSGE